MRRASEAGGLHRRRLERLRRAMRRCSADAFVAGRELCAYLTGFESPVVVVSQESLSLPPLNVPQLASALRELGRVAVFADGSFPGYLLEHLQGAEVSTELGRELASELMLRKERGELARVEEAGRLAAEAWELVPAKPKGRELKWLRAALTCHLLREGAELAEVEVESCRQGKPPFSVHLSVRCRGYWAEMCRVTEEVELAEAYLQARSRAVEALSPGEELVRAEGSALGELQRRLGWEWECTGSFVHGIGVLREEAPMIQADPRHAKLRLPRSASLAVGHAVLVSRGLRLRVEDTLVVRGRHLRTVTA